MAGRPCSLLVDRRNPGFCDCVGTCADRWRFFFVSYDVVEGGRSGVCVHDEAAGDAMLSPLNASLPGWDCDEKTIARTSGKEVCPLWVTENYGREQPGSGALHGLDAVRSEALSAIAPEAIQQPHSFFRRSCQLQGFRVGTSYQQVLR